MKRIIQEIKEAYVYNSFSEFSEHYEQMLKEGYEPNSDSCTPEYYHNHDMDNYYALYNKRIINFIV